MTTRPFRMIDVFPSATPPLIRSGPVDDADLAAVTPRGTVRGTVKVQKLRAPPYTDRQDRTTEGDT